MSFILLMQAHKCSMVNVYNFYVVTTTCFIALSGFIPLGKKLLNKMLFYY